MKLDAGMEGAHLEQSMALVLAGLPTTTTCTEQDCSMNVISDFVATQITVFLLSCKKRSTSYLRIYPSLKFYKRWPGVY